MSEKFASHDPRVVSVFEIVGAYFTDTVFNHVHHSAKVNLTGGSSLTDEYVRRIQAYVLGVKNDGRCYSDVVQGVHAYFTGTTRFTTLGFAEFVDRVVGVCVPDEYFRQFSPQDKDELLSSALCDLVSNLAAFATKPDMLRRIIDGHDKTPDVTIRMLQDAAVNSLITKRAALHNKFLRKMGQARDTVPVDVVDDMKRALRRLVKEKTEAEARAGLAEERADLAEAGLRKQSRDSRQREAKLLKLVELLRRGRDEGAAAVGVGLCMPRRDTLAEADDDDDPLHFGDVRARSPPRRERIAEGHLRAVELRMEPDAPAPQGGAPGARDGRRPSAGDGDGDAAPAGRQRAMPASFFQAGSLPSRWPQPSPAGVSGDGRREQAPEQAPEHVPEQAPAGFGSLFDNVVDTTGDNALDDILYGRE